MRKRQRRSFFLLFAPRSEQVDDACRHLAVLISLFPTTREKIKQRAIFLCPTETLGFRVKRDSTFEAEARPSTSCIILLLKAALVDRDV